MVTMMVLVKVSPEKQEEFLQAMHSLKSAQEAQAVSWTPTLCKEVDDETGFRVIFEWETQENLEEYLRAGISRVLLGAVKVLCNSAEIRYSRTLENLPILDR